MRIECENRKLRDGGYEGDCGRFLMGIPDCVIEALRSNPGEKMTLRCPSCPTITKFIHIYFNEQGQSVFETLDAPVKFDRKMEFDILLTTSQGA